MPHSRPGLWAKILKTTGFSEISAAQFPQNAARRYRREQIKGAHEQAQFLILGNTIFAPILAYQAYAEGPLVLLLVWTALMVGGSWVLHFWTLPLRRCAGEPIELKQMSQRAFIDGTLWWVGMACIYPFATGDAKVIVAIIITGAVALGTFGYSRAPGPGMIYLASSSLGSGAVAFATGLYSNSPSDLFVPLLSIFAFIALAKSVLERARADLVSFQNVESLSAKTEAVELLLRNHESQATEWHWQTDALDQIILAPDLMYDLLGGHQGIAADGGLLSRLQSRTSAESGKDLERLNAAFLGREEFHDIVVALPDVASGDLKWIAIKGRPQFDGDEFTGFRGVVADTTTAVVAERRVQFLARHDSLTSLYNRNTVKQRLEELDSTRDNVTAYLIDLDGFKQVNDSYGHNTGDALLTLVAARLKEISVGRAWVARLAGDEFLAVFPDDCGLENEDLTIIGQELCDRLSEPYSVGSFELQVTASIGMARFPKDTKEGIDLLSLCDLALYDAKNAGRNRPSLFNRSMQERLDYRVNVVERLKIAVRGEVIELHYQPQHRLSDNRLVGFEALARWTDKDLGFVRPDVFIATAEQTGLIIELGEQILQKACHMAKSWFDTYGPVSPIVSVNVSPVQFARSDVVSTVETALSQSGLLPRLLKIEITEGVLISDKARVADTLCELSEMGVSIALDDFGTGYSSLGYLRALPLAQLKIDQSFVHDLDGRAGSPIVSTMIQLANNLQLEVIAEGVETYSQASKLLVLGCEFGQGYHFGEAMPGEATQEHLNGFLGPATVPEFREMG